MIIITAMKLLIQTKSFLVETGFNENTCKCALYEAGNSSDPEISMEWLMSCMETGDIGSPFNPRSVKTPADSWCVALELMLAICLEAKLCKKPLILNSGEVNRSVERVFNNLDDDGELQPPKPVPTNREDTKRVRNL